MDEISSKVERVVGGSTVVLAFRQYDSDVEIYMYISLLQITDLESTDCAISKRRR